MVREELLDAKKAVAQGKSPAHEKQREKRRLTAAKTFGDVTDKWLVDARIADSTEAMCKSIVDRDILPAFQNRMLNEITADDLRALCGKVKVRGAPATAVHVRDIVKQVYAVASLHGERAINLIEHDLPRLTAEPISAEALRESRERLLARGAGWLDKPSCAFLRSVEDEKPDFGILGLSHASQLPGVRRKLHNLAQRAAAKREADRRELEQTLERIAGRAG